MASTWDEVKRLAADFQRAQLSSTVQRLSERNCIEIVKKLIELKLIDVIFTSDGKEYLTPQRLLKEIKDELYVHGGRINLVELAQIIGVDFSHIETKANEFARSEPGIRIVLGQLITSDYLDHIGEEINEKLQQTGQITIGELTKQYDLPGDFLLEAVIERLDIIIKATADVNDDRTFFTETFIAQHRARIQGILSGITRPVSVANILNNFQIPERLFYSVSDELIKSGRIAGSLTSSRSDKAIFIPDIYAKSQHQWVESFYRQNGYLEYDSLSRLGIMDPKSYIRKQFKDESLIYLKSCCVGNAVTSHVESVIEEALTSGSWVDVMPVLPSVLTTEDCQQMIQSIIKSVANSGGIVRVFCDTVVVSDNVMQNCLGSFESLMNTRAQEDIVNKPHLFIPQQQAIGKTAFGRKEDTITKSKQDKKEERKKKSGKHGGGTQGRETKIRSVKKKYLANKGNDDSGSEDEMSMVSSKGGFQDDLHFASVDDIKNHLQSNLLLLQDSPEDLISEIAEEIHRPLNKKYEEVARALYSAASASSVTSRRKLYGDFQEKLGGLLNHIYYFEKGIKVFSDDIAAQLNKHLLKTLCTDALNMMVNYLTYDQGIVSSTELTAELSAENRLKLIEKLSEEFKQPMKKLHTTMNSKTLEDFWSTIEAALDAGVCDVSLKKNDKKKERLVLANHRQSLLSQLSEAKDPALCLHLAVLVIFQTQTRCMLHASGKFVPQIISYLQKHVPSDVYQNLAICQEHVVKQLTSTQSEEEAEKTNAVLEEIMPKIVECAATFKKGSVSETEP